MNDSLVYELWISRFTSLLSILGSSAIIYIILFSGSESKLTKPKNRLMLMMSIFDILQSSAIAVGTAPVPSDSGIYGAIGNSTTCTIQSIFLSIGMAVPCYNSSLNLFYLLIIRYNMTQAQFATNLEPFLHAFSVLGPISLTFIFVALGYSGPLDGACMLSAGKPPIYIFCTFISLCLVFCIYSMGSISWSVISQAKRMKRHRFASSRTNNASILGVKETVKQALSYSFAFLMTFLFVIITAFVNNLNPENKVPALSILRSIFYPLQGFFNFICYIRPGVNHARKTDPSKSLIGAMKEVIFNPQNLSSSTTPTSTTRIRRLHPQRQLKNTTNSVKSKGGNSPQSAVNDEGEKAALDIDSITESETLDDSKQHVISNNDNDLRIYTADNNMLDRDEESCLHNKAEQRRLSLVSLASVLSDVPFDNFMKDIASEETDEGSEKDKKSQPSRFVGRKASFTSIASAMSDIS